MEPWHLHFSAITRARYPPIGARAAISELGSHCWASCRLIAAYLLLPLEKSQDYSVCVWQGWKQLRKHRMMLKYWDMLCIEMETMPIFNIFSMPQIMLLMSMASLHPTVLHRKPNNASIGSLQNFLVRTKTNLASLSRNLMHMTFH